jgi:DNA-binding MarR family transcriptional regulator
MTADAPSIREVPPLNREIGQAERTLRELLDSALAAAGATFPEWTVVAVLGAGPLDRERLVAQLAAGRVAVRDEVIAAIDRMRDGGLLRVDDADRVALTRSGIAHYAPLRDQVTQITQIVHAGLSPADVEVARRVLAQVASRAAALLPAH